MNVGCVVLMQTLSCAAHNCDILVDDENVMYVRCYQPVFFVYRLHRMQEMHSILTDVCGVCLSVSLSVTRLISASLRKMAEQIKMLCGVGSGSQF